MRIPIRVGRVRAVQVAVNLSDGWPVVVSVICEDAGPCRIPLEGDQAERVLSLHWSMGRKRFLDALLACLNDVPRRDVLAMLAAEPLWQSPTDEGREPL